jgi:hypothetical protein
LVDSGISAISLNAAITGLKFFFELTIKRAGLMAARLADLAVAATSSRHRIVNAHTETLWDR